MMRKKTLWSDEKKIELDGVKASRYMCRKLGADQYHPHNEGFLRPHHEVAKTLGTGKIVRVEGMWQCTEPFWIKTCARVLRTSD